MKTNMLVPTKKLSFLHSPNINSFELLQNCSLLRLQVNDSADVQAQTLSLTPSGNMKLTLLVSFCDS